MKKKDIIICRCEEIYEREIISAIKEGATTIAEIKRKTRAGMGLCQGRTCRNLIARLICNQAGIPIKEILPATFRPPVRVIKIRSLVGDENCFRKKQK